MMTSTASTALCTARTGTPQRVWRRGSHRSHPRAKMCGKHWCGTSPLMSPLKAPTPTAGHRSCSACMDQMCSGTMWFAAMGLCTCPSHLAGTKGPFPCLSQNLHLNCRNLQAGSWGGGPSTQTPRWWLRVKAGKVKLPPLSYPQPRDRLEPGSGWAQGWGECRGPARYMGASPQMFPDEGLVGAQRVCHVCLSRQPLYLPVRGLGQALLSPFYR
ncbi:B9D1 isoform 1 [Pongo abelii]|uniref:B9D1 isoform 1 n=3 Tax=Pongo abelii TaxID=9601 RepID=A0A2J8RCB3_PONAB|nr:B9D1 isoform 1 [Pongo abelii]